MILQNVVKEMYQNSSMVDLTDRKDLAVCSPAHCEPSAAAGVGKRGGQQRRFGGVDHGSQQTLVWYRRSQQRRD